ncbi:MAG TPA: D-alanyl-D-alanine-carboxypeptidase/endopeptidase AmpH [Caulobacteraceae bacterium]|jgi:D-alanyl-D-alanine-carboxypeptidase/D-alanyl-D-alanine-endopeptidase
MSRAWTKTWGGAAARLAIGCLVAVGLFACTPKKEMPPQPKAPIYQLDPALAALYAESGAQGMVVAVVRDDKVIVRGFGRVHTADPTVPDGATLVRLESISKLFASDLLAHMAAQGKVKLSDPLPEPVRRRGKAPASITLLQLASHTSGLPRVAPIDPKLNAAGSAALRLSWLETRAHRDPPGVGGLYSNVAFDLLGDHLAAVAGAPYVAALKTQVTGPLMMIDTTSQPTPEECARFLDADPARPPKPCIDQSGFTASGGLYSTADDIGKWLKAQLGAGLAEDPVRRISQAVYIPRSSLKTAVGLDHAGFAEGVGLAWIEEAATANHPLILEKTGGGDGFLTYVVIDPARRVGLFFAIDHVGHGVLTPMTQTANDIVGALGTSPG